MHTSDRHRQDRQGKLGQFLALSLLVHLLMALAPGGPMVRTTIQIPAPEPILATITSPPRTPHVSHPAATPVDTAPAPGETALRKPSPDSETRTASDPALANQLRSLLHAALDQHFVYPEFARRQGWEGRVDVLVHLDRDGRLDAMRVVHSSGYGILDQDALLALQRIVTIPEARAWLRGYSYDLQLPVIYRLTEG